MDQNTKTTLCWNCSMSYPIKYNQCPVCCATNANYDIEAAKTEMENSMKIEHKINSNERTF